MLKTNLNLLCFLDTKVSSRFEPEKKEPLNKK